ncbi:hypothetical protein [Dactylosporangium darangshiense]|uniref:Lipoprotein n=1 Tax=Dactylosporangium darangshiense TaxID=579108 RepID=A0ABP8D7A5_9ACTN
MRIHLLAAALACALLGGCTGGARDPGRPAGTAGGTTAASADAAAVFRQVAECFRAHGHPDFPDPVLGADGMWGFPADTERVDVPEPCADVFRQSKAVYPNRPKGPVVTASGLALARRFAQCMRDNGVPDWPDPNPDGTYTVPDRLVRPEDESLWQPAASGPCKAYAPPGGPEVKVG